MAHQKIRIKTDSGEEVEAMAPVIVSASRSTDIPAYYAEWFVNRLKNKSDGYVVWHNPFNGKPSYVSFARTKVIVFWSKNPKPLIPYLDRLDRLGLHYYFQFTLNDYEKEGFERNVPSLEKRIDTFKELSRRVGAESVIWRFDPIIFTPALTPRELAKRIFKISQELKGFTKKLVISFVNVGIYKKVQRNLLKYSPELQKHYDRNSINAVEGTDTEIATFCKYMQRMQAYWKQEGWNLQITSCGEERDLSQFGILPNKCVDDELIFRLFGDDKEVRDVLFPGKEQDDLFDIFQGRAEDRIFPIHVKTSLKKDPGQRKVCRCVESKDIGAYNTCAHGCIYCYANSSIELALQNLKRQRSNPNVESLTIKDRVRN